MGISCDGYSSRTHEELMGKIDGKESEKIILIIKYIIFYKLYWLINQLLPVNGNKPEVRGWGENLA